MPSGEERLAGVEGFEPSADGFGDRCSTRLSYTPARCLILRGRRTLRNEARVTETESPSLRKGLTGGRTAHGLEGPAMPFYRQGSQTQSYRGPRVQPHCWKAEPDDVKCTLRNDGLSTRFHTSFPDWCLPSPPPRQLPVAPSAPRRYPILTARLRRPPRPPPPARPRGRNATECYKMLQRKKLASLRPLVNPNPHSRARNEGRPDRNAAARGCSFALTGYESAPRLPPRGGTPRAELRNHY